MSFAPVQPTDGHVVAMTGAVSPGIVIAVHRTLTAAVDAGHRSIVVDLSEVTLLGAQTAGLLCGALRLLSRRGVTLAIIGGPPHLQRIFAAFGGSPGVTRWAERNPRRRLEFGTNVDVLTHPSTAETAETPA